MRVNNAAGLITEPGTGEIRAMAGSHDFFDTAHDGQVNVVLQPRQPGSSIKPITYTLAFLSGLTPNSTIEDAPVCFTIAGSPNYCPKNYDGRYHGTVTARTALASSYNIPATKLLNSLGVMSMVNLARRMGITTWDDPSRFGLSLTLGGGEVTMVDMAEVYGVFANGGIKVPLTSITSVKDQTGKELWTPAVHAKEEVIPPGVAYQISSILSDPAARAPAFGIHSVLNIPEYPVAVKTGTTNNLRDNWTFGYTPDVLVATWVGNNDNTPMSSVASGITGASPIWSRTMQRLLAGTDPHPFTPPDRMVAVAICPTNGAAYCSNQCGAKSRMEYFVPGTEPKKNCSETGTLLQSSAQTSQ
jgi:membrane peptidoglycan carboxypeptidase